MEKITKAKCDLCGRVGWYSTSLATFSGDAGIANEEGKTLCVGPIKNYVIVNNGAPIEERSRREVSRGEVFFSKGINYDNINMLKQSSKEEIKLTCPQCNGEIDYEYFLNTYGPEGCFKIAEKLTMLAIKDCTDGVKQANELYPFQKQNKKDSTKCVKCTFRFEECSPDGICHKK